MSAETQTTANEKLLSEFSPTPYEEWRKEVEAQLKGATYEKKVMTPTYEGITLQPLYRQDDVEGIPNIDSLPGTPPYTRGSRAAGYRGKAWEICQELPYSTAETFNEAVKYDLERGQTAVNLLLDQATLLGLDPDEAKAGDVGRGGVSIATVDDLATALDGVDLETVPVYINSSSAATPATAMLVALIKRQGKSPAKLQGGVEMDPLGILAREGTFPRSVAGAYNRMAHVIDWAKTNAPQLKIVTVHGQPYSDSGSSAVQELAYVIATAVEYVREMQARNLTVDEIAPRIRFSLSSGSNYFMEVAKIRAARLLWAKVIKAFGGNDESQKVAIHVRTSAWNKTTYDPYVNMLRTTTEAFAGAVGGCDSMHVSQFDEAIRPPDEFSRRIARNTQLILQNEANMTKVVDPAGGSWYIENLTNAVAKEAWALFQNVEKQGGMYKALQAGSPQAEVAKTAEQRVASIATRKDVFVGTNRYANATEKPLESYEPDYKALSKKRAKYVTEYRAGLGDIQSKVDQIVSASPEASFETAIEAAFAGATVGQIASALRSGDEDKATVTPLNVHRGTEAIEAMRRASEAYQTKTGSRPKVFLANIGPIPQHKPRADFSTDFFQTGGFEIITNDGFATADEAAKAALDSGASIVTICSTDATYPDVVPALTKAVKGAKSNAAVIVAGYPKDQIEAFKAAGVDDFIHMQANVYQVITDLQKKLGVI
jgi:methylmalonyl-CoA mutase